MKSKSRKKILILDNATSHRDPNLSNVKLIFLPPNAGALIQPLDMGIIKVAKGGYIRELTNHIIAKIDTKYELLDKRNLYYSGYWLVYKNLERNK